MFIIIKFLFKNENLILLQIAVYFVYRRENLYLLVRRPPIPTSHSPITNYHSLHLTMGFGVVVSHKHQTRETRCSRIPLQGSGS